MKALRQVLMSEESSSFFCTECSASWLTGNLPSFTVTYQDNISSQPKTSHNCLPCLSGKGVSSVMLDQYDQRPIHLGPSFSQRRLNNVRTYFLISEESLNDLAEDASVELLYWRFISKDFIQVYNPFSHFTFEISTPDSALSVQVITETET